LHTLPWRRNWHFVELQMFIQIMPRKTSISRPVAFQLMPTP
jgi:hypothetical protein